MKDDASEFLEDKLLDDGTTPEKVEDGSEEEASEITFDDIALDSEEEKEENAEE